MSASPRSSRVQHIRENGPLGPGLTARDFDHNFKLPRCGLPRLELGTLRIQAKAALAWSFVETRT